MNLIVYPSDYFKIVAYALYSQITLSGKSRRTRRRKALKMLENMYEELNKHQELMRLRPLILEVVRLIKNNFTFIIRHINSDEKTLRRVRHARFMKGVWE